MTSYSKLIKTFDRTNERAVGGFGSIQKKIFILMMVWVCVYVYKFVKYELLVLVFIVMFKANLTMDSQINIYQKDYKALRFSIDIYIHKAITWTQLLILCIPLPMHSLYAIIISRKMKNTFIRQFPVVMVSKNEMVFECQCCRLYPWLQT